MFTARELIGKNSMSVIDPQGSIRKTFFWFLDRDNKKKCAKLNKQNAYLYAKKFLPQFGFYKYRENEQEDGPFLIVQKCGRRVRIIGNEKDIQVQDRIFEWTLETIKTLSGIAGDLPKDLEERIFEFETLFSKWTTRFLPRLPEVEVTTSSGETLKVPQQPLKDTPNTAFLCFTNGVVVVNKDDDPELHPYLDLPPNAFVWDNEVKDYAVDLDHLKEGPSGKWWDFLQNLAKEDHNGKWVVNPGLLQTLTTAYGYVLHDFYPPDNRRMVILYDRTCEMKSGGNGKSIIGKSFNCVKPIHTVDMKHEKDGGNRFLFSGYTPDRRTVILSDTSRELNFERFYNLITDGFTVEDKGEKKYVLSEDHSPKMVLTTNYTISNSDRSDRRRQFFVPIGTFYGTLYDRSGFTPADIHDGYLLDKRTWSDKDWSDFYATCIHCVKEYLDQGLVPFDDTVLVDRQLLKSVAGRDDLLTDLTHFIKGVVDGPGEVSREEVIKVFGSPEYEDLNRWGDPWKVRTFKKVAMGLGYLVNPGRDRFQKVVNGVTEDWYRIVPSVQPSNPLEGFVETSGEDQGSGDLRDFFTDD